MGLPIFWRAHTPRIKPRGPGNSVASLEKIRLGGVDQWILIRGQERSNPIVLFLHGGPGMPAMYLAHKFQRPLEQDFVMVQWDRRGAGKSYTKEVSPDSISVEQEIADTVELTNALRSRFNQEKILLVGHSYGTYLGMITVKRFPKLFHAYIGIGQLAYSDVRNHLIQDRWIREQAVSRHESEALEELDGKIPLDREKWLWKFGGEMHLKKSWRTLLSIGLRSPEYSLMDALNVRKGVAFTHKNMRYNAISQELIDGVDEVDVPVYFFTGRFDYVDPFECVEEYAKRLQAPRKELVWFEESAHFAFLEEPEKFAEQLKQVAHQPP